MKLPINPMHILFACIGMVAFGVCAYHTDFLLFIILFWICAGALALLALFQFIWPLYYNYKNTFKNVCYVIFASIINTAYAYNFADIAEQNGLFVAICCFGVVLCPLAFLIAKLIKEA